MFTRIVTKGSSNFGARPSARPFLTVVYQTEVCYREFLGGNRVRLDPGLHLSLPALHVLHRVGMREAGFAVRKLNCYTADNVPVTLSGRLFVQVEDPEKACFAVEDYHESLFSVGQATVRAVVGRFQYDEIIRERNAVNEEMRRSVETSTVAWGARCSRFELEEFSPQNKSVAEALERQMNAERQRRERELNTQADIRTAEGEKVASNHRTDAALYSAQMTADATKYTSDKATEALATRIAQIRAALPELSNVQVMTLVLEERRLDHLSEIAKNPKGKNTYFIDPHSSFPSFQALLAQTLGGGVDKK